MKVDNVNKSQFEMLDCQVDLILRSLQFYAYTYKFIYPRRGKNETKEENLRLSLVTDTYEQILNQYTDSKSKKKIFEKIS